MYSALTNVAYDGKPYPTAQQPGKLPVTLEEMVPYSSGSTRAATPTGGANRGQHWHQQWSADQICSHILQRRANTSRLAKHQQQASRWRVPWQATSAPRVLPGIVAIAMDCIVAHMDPTRHQDVGVKGLSGC